MRDAEAGSYGGAAALEMHAVGGALRAMRCAPTHVHSAAGRDACPPAGSQVKSQVGLVSGHPPQRLQRRAQLCDACGAAAHGRRRRRSAQEPAQLLCAASFTRLQTQNGSKGIPFSRCHAVWPGRASRVRLEHPRLAGGLPSTGSAYGSPTRTSPSAAVGTPLTVIFLNRLPQRGLQRHKNLQGRRASPAPASLSTIGGASWAIKCVGRCKHGLPLPTPGSPTAHVA